MKHAKIHRINNMNKKLSDSFIKNNKTITITIIIITVFFYFTQHFAAPFLEVWLMSALSFFFVKYLPATITQAL